MSKYCQELLRETLGGNEPPKPDYSDFGLERVKGKAKKEERRQHIACEVEWSGLQL